MPPRHRATEVDRVAQRRDAAAPLANNDGNATSAFA
jgi:hypothetical protein